MVKKSFVAIYGVVSELSIVLFGNRQRKVAQQSFMFSILNTSHSTVIPFIVAGKVHFLSAQQLINDTGLVLKQDSTSLPRNGFAHPNEQSSLADLCCNERIVSNTSARHGQLLFSHITYILLSINKQMCRADI